MKKLAEAQSRIAIPAKTQRNHKRSFFMRILKNFSVGLVLVINGITIQRVFTGPFPKVNGVKMEKSKKKSREVSIDKIVY